MKRLFFGILLTSALSAAFGGPCDVLSDEVKKFGDAYNGYSGRGLQAASKDLDKAIEACDSSGDATTDVGSLLGTLASAYLDSSEFARQRASTNKSLLEANSRRVKEESEANLRRMGEERRKFTDEADPGNYTFVANTIALDAKMNSIVNAQSAVQATQIATAAQLDLARFQIKQNDEIIRLLRILAKEKK